MSNIVMELAEFFNHPVFIITGGLTLTITAIGIVYGLCCRLFGITPILLRLGLALWKRKIAIFSSNEQFQSLQTTLVDSGIFSKDNITYIENNNIEKSKASTVFLVDWASYHDKIDDVFSARNNHQTPVVIYAKPQAISKRKMTEIANRPNTVVVNFRGRLLNDILTSLITSTYDG